MILDNLSAHETKLVEALLNELPTVTLHFTPTCSPWLNQVEVWFSESAATSGVVGASSRPLPIRPRSYDATSRAYAKQATTVSLEVRQPGAVHRPRKPTSETAHQLDLIRSR